MSAARRATVLVIDACGVGALPDARDYGDEDTNTLAHVARRAGGLRLPVLGSLGLGSIIPLQGVAPARAPAIFGRLHRLGPGKDSVTGHWEMMGVVAERALPTYPGGFPAALLGELVAAMGHEVICNRADDGLSAIAEFGAEHLRTGALILYTSQDSVLQLAAHVDRVPAQELYRACAAARRVMSGPNAVGRVIARPFTGVPGDFRRTAGRRDLALEPPGPSYLLELQRAGVSVQAVGKISELFAGVGISGSHPAATNSEALDAVASLAGEQQAGLVFANLIDTDQLYGHRKDAHGFARALAEIDAALGSLLARLGGDDLVIVTADHGVDPDHPGSDHTREYAPLLAVSGEMLGAGQRALGAAGQAAAGGRRAGAAAGGHRHDGPLADVGASVLAWLTGGRATELPGEPFIS